MVRPTLLKDPDGKIDVDLPVRGNVDDPEFRYGGLIWKALTNLIIKIVASPFALLANLVGAESSDLEYLVFIEGRTDLTPPEQEKIAKLAEALTMRPALALEISGVVDREADGLAMRTAKLERIVEERIAAMRATARKKACSQSNSAKCSKPCSSSNRKPGIRNSRWRNCVPGTRP
jgi:hypothetical protein